MGPLLVVIARECSGLASASGGLGNLLNNHYWNPSSLPGDDRFLPLPQDLLHVNTEVAGSPTNARVS